MNKLMEELSMLTGVMSDDREYLVALLLAGGKYKKEKEKEAVTGVRIANPNVIVAKKLEDWLK